MPIKAKKRPHWLIRGGETLERQRIHHEAGEAARKCLERGDGLPLAAADIASGNDLMAKSFVTALRTRSKPTGPLYKQIRRGVWRVYVPFHHRVDRLERSLLDSKST